MKTTLEQSYETAAPMTRRNMLSVTAIAAAGGALGAVLATQPASAEDAKPALVGMWEIIVKFPDGVENPTLILFTENGSVVETNALTRASGLGQWKQVEDRKFDYVFWEQFFDAANKHVSNIRVHHLLTLAEDGATYTAEGDGKIFDLKGAQVGEVKTTITGRRLS